LYNKGEAELKSLYVKNPRKEGSNLHK